jgi:hypothetical protein
MESRNREEAERAIRENRRSAGTPEDLERRRDTVGREHEMGRGSIPYSSDDAGLPDLNAGGIGERGVEGYAERTDPEIAGSEELDSGRSITFSPNDDMAGEGWTVPEEANEGWVLPQDPPIEDRLDNPDYDGEGLPGTEDEEQV